MKLEELARQSSDAARAAVVHLDPPALGADARNRGRMPVLLGAAAVLLVVGLGTFWALRDDPTETVTAGSGELPVLGLADPAAFGLELAGMFDPDEMADQMAEEFSATFVYFGTPDADDPYADGDLLVGELVSDEPEPLSEGTTVTVRGGLQASVPGPDSGLPGTTTLEWYEPTDDGDVQMVLASDSLDVDQLVAVADSLDLSAGIEAVTFSDEAALPEAIRDLEVVAVDDGFPAYFASFRAPDGPLVAYERAETISSSMVESIVVSSSPGDPTADSMAAERWWASSAELVQVGERPGLLLTYEFGDIDGNDAGDMNRVHTVTWQWAPGVMASVTATTTGGSEFALEVADAVVELEPALLDDAQGEALTNQATADFDEVWGAGAGTTDIAGSTESWAWALGLQNDQFCSSLHVGSGGSSSCEPLAQLLDRVPDAPVVVAQQVMDGLQFGVIVASPDHLVLPAEGTPGELTEVLVPNDADGTRLLVWVGPADAPARFDALVDGRDPIVLDLADGVAAEEWFSYDDDTTVVEEPIGTENMAPPVPVIDVASHPSAQSMGIADDFSVEASGGNGRIFWVIGTHEGESYIVADGEATFAALLPDDVTVVKPIELPDGTAWTYVVARDVPACAEVMGVSEVTTSQSDETTAGPDLLVWPLEGTADGWRLLFNTPRDDVWVDLPDIEGSIAWPETLCGEAATAAAEAVSLADLDVGVLASMAAEGILVDGITLPPGFEYEGASGDDSSWSYLFTSVFPRDISIGWQLGEEPSFETAPDSIRSQQLTLETPTGDRSVSTREYGPPGRGEVRVTYPVNGRRVEVTGSDVAVDVLLDVMTDLVVLDPVYDSGATPTLEEARAALDGLPLTDALRVATEAGWQIRTNIINGQSQPLNDDLRPNRVNVSITEYNAVVVLGVG